MSPPPYEAWSIGGCLYSCTPCRANGTERIFNCSLDMIRHARDAHGMGWKLFRTVFGGTRIKWERMQCEECGAEVTFDRGKMQAHMIGRHGFGLREYYDKHVAGNGK